MMSNTDIDKHINHNTMKVTVDTTICHDILLNLTGKINRCKYVGYCKAFRCLYFVFCH